jgi:hypothetical protein
MHFLEKNCEQYKSWNRRFEHHSDDSPDEDDKGLSDEDESNYDDLSRLLRLACWTQWGANSVFLSAVHILQQSWGVAPESMVQFLKTALEVGVPPETPKAIQSVDLARYKQILEDEYEK